jgi:Mg2+ and Co2+ transporter CorA
MTELDDRIHELERGLFAGQVNVRWRDELAQVHGMVLDDPALSDQRETLRQLLELGLEVRDFEVMQLAGKMTAITLILVIDALIAGIYGMNVAFPAFADPAGWVRALALIVVATVVSTLTLRWKGWF